VAAVGFALTCWPIGVERGWMSREEARERTLTTIRFFHDAPQGPQATGVSGHKGFFYHFLDIRTGHRFRRTQFNLINFSRIEFVRREFGGGLTSNPDVRNVHFTGSTEVGATLLAQCAPTIKKTSMELGGNAPFIVFDDADLDAAVQGALASKYRNAGQTCVCAHRLLVQDGIYDAFAAKLKTAVEALKVGNGFEDGVTIGPLIDDNAVRKAEEHVADAVERGASVLYLAPTKALAHDQLSGLASLGLDVRLAAHDGDSSREERDWTRDFGEYVLTNPDMLHRSLLPSHQRWSRLLGSLQYVVVDECHHYRGVFGAHVSHVLRRLHAGK